ncbi:MAG: 50S ribosomal protein L15 [Nitrospirae bacterium]|nr:50S ribosomal protein L15 [Nitrospirota bacterium]MCZ6780558.1 50S ribosomal protein L15 [Nitrospirota bacterium]
MKLHTLAPSAGAKKKPKRVGRGPGSGHGKTATRGHKGMLSRSGGGKRPGFEGGQMPLARRVPKHGFTNPFRTEYAIVNLKSLAALGAVDPVTPEVLVDAGLIKRKTKWVKILGLGGIEKPLTIHAHRFSKSAIEKIQAAGGRAEVIGCV